jgi:antitoxin HigA-1
MMQRTESTERLKNVHPGDILSEEFLKPLGMTPYRLSKEIGISQTHIGQIIRGERGITAPVALRLAVFFSTTPRFWTDLQALYDLEEAQKNIAEQIAAIRPWSAERTSA